MAELTTRQRENLPDSAYACPEKRLYPHHKADGSLDLPHLRNALARIGDSSNDQCGKAHLEAHARSEGMGERGKAVLPVKAQVMDTDELEAWFAGRIPRRILSLPFGGPIPSAKSSIGVDLDGEWMGPDLDPYGPHKALRETRDRLVDFHHSYAPPGPAHGDPTGVMRGVILGKSVLDDEPDEDGYWSDIWLRYGEKRLALVKSLIKRGGQLFGSSQPASGVVKDPETGEIKVWPHLLQTLSPSPQNTLAVLKPKAALDLIDSHFPVHDALKAFVTDLDNLGADLPLTSYLDGGAGDVAAKAGRVLSARNERALREALSTFGSLLDEMVAQRDQATPTEGDASD